MSSHAFIWTDTELDLWIPMGSKLRMVDGRYHVTVWNWYYPIFFTLIKNMTEEANISATPHIYVHNYAIICTVTTLYQY
jgi:hypothetical protein